MLINKKIAIFQLKQTAKEINMSTQKKNSLNGQKCQFLHKKQKKNKNSQLMTHDNHYACCTNQNILLPSFVGSQKEKPATTKKKNTILSWTHIAFNHDQVTQLFHPF